MTSFLRRKASIPRGTGISDTFRALRGGLDTTPLQRFPAKVKIFKKERFSLTPPPLSAIRSRWIRAVPKREPFARSNVLSVSHHSLDVETDGRKPIDITSAVQEIVAGSGVVSGLCNVFVHHTSASLILCENADPDVHFDLETAFSRLAPDGHPDYRHRSEGIDDMSAHIRSILTLPSLTLPVKSGRCDLGTWQGIYLWEHRSRHHKRRLTVTVMGD